MAAFATSSIQGSHVRALGVMIGTEFDPLLQITRLLLHAKHPGVEPCFSYTIASLRPGETPHFNLSLITAK